MSGKRILPLVCCVCLMMSACSMQAHIPSSPDIEGPTASPKVSGPEPQSIESKSGVIEFRQNTPALPDAQTLSSYPGVLESVSLTLEEIITVLGTQFELLENKAQGYDTYYYPQYQLSLDFDKTSKRLSTISLDGTLFNVYSAVYQLVDLNGDGIAEKIVAYEDQNYEGTLLVIDGATGKESTATLDYFGNYCALEVLTDFGSDKENLILISTRGGKEAEIFSYRDGVLGSILPENYDALAESSLVSIEGTTAVWVNSDKNLLYLCPLPQEVANSVRYWSNEEAHRYQVSLEPRASEDELTLKVKTSLEVKLSDGYNFMEGSDGIFCDVAQVVESYEYLGQGQWQKATTEENLKYQDELKIAPVFEDLSIAGLKLYDSYETLNPAFADLSLYTPDELNMGILIENEGVRVGISQNFISYLSLEEGAREATSKGLKLSDSREKALSLYGLPHQGYLDDDVWTYYVINDSGEYDAALFCNTLNLEFHEDKVCRIWISSYVTAY